MALLSLQKEQLSTPAQAISLPQVELAAVSAHPQAEPRKRSAETTVWEQPWAC